MKRVSNMTRSARNSFRLAAIICWSGFAGGTYAQTSGPVYTSTGVYDENVVSATTIAKTAVSSNVSLDDFKTHMATAYTNNAGGVINFDLVSAPSELTNRFFTTYGQSNSFLFSVTRNDLDGSGGGLNTNSNEPNRISGANYLGISNGSNFDIFFSTPLIEFGITAVSRAAGGDRTGVMTIRYSDNSTPFVFQKETMVQDGGGTGLGNTFFGHIAPANKFISGISWVSHTSATDTTPNDGNFVRWDDLGFSTSNLAPCDVDGLNGCTTVDADIIRQNLLLTGANRGQGDLTGDGIVNLFDFKLWKSLAGSGSLGIAGAVPEPSSLLLSLLVSSAALLRIRKRRRAVSPANLTSA